MSEERSSMLEQRRVLVVGASRGIGAAIGRACAEAGAQVAVSARSVDKLEAVAEACGPRAVALPCDVQDETQCRALVEATVERLGGLDALVYATGMSIFRPVGAMSLDAWETVFRTNVFGAACITGAALPHLVAAKGHAVYLGSESSLYEPTPWRGIGAYIASKRALDSVVRSFQLENPDVAFTNLVVGATVTEFGSDDPDTVMELATEWATLGYVKAGVLEPDDHAEVIVHLLGLPSRVLLDHIGVRVRPSHQSF
jgi:NAD(P)-dependent dehydrogenase (short-subunit alcohol dehydrogenase family)